MEELKVLLSKIDELADKCMIKDGLPNNPLTEGYNDGVKTFAIWVKQRINMMLYEGGEL